MGVPLELCKQTKLSRIKRIQYETVTKTKRNKMTYTYCSYFGGYPYALQGMYDARLRGCRARSEMKETLVRSLDMWREGVRDSYREFTPPQPVLNPGRYYPHNCIAEIQSASPYVPYLARPYLNYCVPSKYGFSKYCTVRKL